jgi:hypothetical protein
MRKKVIYFLETIISELSLDTNVIKLIVILEDFYQLIRVSTAKRL